MFHLKAIIISTFAMVIFSATTYAVGISSEASAEIEHLLNYISSSGCEFYRNGTWHKVDVAREHLTKKYQYLLKNKLIKNAEDFIAGAATKSSMSGEPYQVRCGNNIFPCADWLTAELARFRQKQIPPK